MRRQRVSSSSVVSVGYDGPSQSLELEFAGGAVYRYRRVPRLVYDELLRAPSKGRFVNAFVRDTFAYSKLD